MWNEYDNYRTVRALTGVVRLRLKIRRCQNRKCERFPMRDVSQWDGRTIRDREQQITQAALILAGQCIALLLHNLSQLSEAHATASKQTWGWPLPTSIGHGRRWMQVLTLGNVVVSLWLPDVVERPPQPKGKPRKVREARHFALF